MLINVSQKAAAVSLAVTGLTAAIALATSVAHGTPAGPANPTAQPAPAAVPDPLTAATTGYVRVDGIDIYYEVHGTGEPLVLLHSGYTTIDISFGAMTPVLAQDRQVIAIEQQGHGRTADREGSLTYERMADDTAAVLEHLNVEQADIFGHSLGGGIAMQLAISHPELVRKLIVASTPFNNNGLYPGVLEAIAQVKPEDFAGSGLPEAYAALAPNPQGWPTLVEKLKRLDLTFQGWTRSEIRSIAAPTLVVVGDSDTVTVPHAARLFRLVGGGVPGDVAGPPASQLLVLPGTTHVGVLAERTDWLLSAITLFLEASTPSEG